MQPLSLCSTCMLLLSLICDFDRMRLRLQWNPVLPAVWGPPYWGHIVSSDLVHWQRLPPALVPDTEYDEDGCFSGSTTLVDGVPMIFYTGA